MVSQTARSHPTAHIFFNLHIYISLTAPSHPAARKCTIRSILNRFRSILEHFWSIFERLGSILERLFLEHFGPFLEHFGAFLEHFGVLWEHFGAFLEHFRTFLEHYKQLTRPATHYAAHPTSLSHTPYYTYFSYLCLVPCAVSHENWLNLWYWR